MQRVPVRTHRRVAASTADAAQWWPRFTAASMATARKRTAQRVKAAAAVARVTVARSAPTPAQRAEREQTARRRLEEEIEARAVLLRHRARQRTAEREADRARRQPSAPVQAAMHEATRRDGGLSAAPLVGVGRDDAGAVADAGAVRALGGAMRGCGKRPADGVRDERAPVRARLIR